MFSQLRVKLDQDARMPRRAHATDAGLDLMASKGCMVNPREIVPVRTGVHVEMPEGFVGIVSARSGLSTRNGVTLINGIGVIDSGYRGEVVVPLTNLSDDPYPLHAGERIAQLLVVPCVLCNPVRVEELSDSERGDGGFGSTGAM